MARTRRLSRGIAALVAALLLVAGALLLADRERTGGAHDGLRFQEADYADDAFPDPTMPLVGTNYTHHDFRGCTGSDTGILATYHEPGVAEAVHRQLGTMRRNGIASLRLIVWHMTDVPRQTWGVVPSRGGRLAEPFRGNLIAFATEARRFGFQRLTVSFSPQWTNSPLRANYDPRLLEENRAFIDDVWTLVLEHGPGDARLDLLNEGAPSGHLPPADRRRLADYVGRLWTAHVRTHGTDDATVSAIAPRHPRDRGDRLGNLADVLAATGEGMPGWFEIHLNYGPEGVGHGLRYADSTLAARGLGQPLTIGETAYDDPAVAAVIADHLVRSDRPLTEITQWYLRAGDDCEIAPPYRADAYLDVARVGGG